MNTHSTIEELVSYIHDGDSLAIATQLGDYSGVAMAATRALIRRGVRGLHIVCVPGSSMQLDLLVGAGCVATSQAGTVSMYEHGAAPRYIAAQHDGSLVLRESTCPAIEAGLSASARGAPFMPVRGIIGSDVLEARRADWKVIDNPFMPGDPILLVPAIQPDVALFHAPIADRHGNVWIGRRTSIALMARAARQVLVTYEHFHDGNLFDDLDKAAGTLAATYVTALSHQPRGSWPLGHGSDYAEDRAHVARYVAMAKTQEGFDRYLAEEGIVAPKELTVEAH